MYQNNTELVKKILDLGGNKHINTTGKKYTPLQMSIEKDNADIACLLLNSGADVDLYEKYRPDYSTSLPYCYPPVFMVLRKMVDKEESDFEKQLKILEAMLNNGLKTDAVYEYFVPKDKFFANEKLYSIDQIDAAGLLIEIENEKYVKMFCDVQALNLSYFYLDMLEEEESDRVVDLMEQYGWYECEQDTFTRTMEECI